MTPDDLRAIAQHHAFLQARWEEKDNQIADHDAHAKIGVLLSLVRQVAEMDPQRPYGTCVGEWDGCAFCMVSLTDNLGVEPHKPDCLWLVAQGAKP